MRESDKPLKKSVQHHINNKYFNYLVYRILKMFQKKISQYDLKSA